MDACQSIWRMSMRMYRFYEQSKHRRCKTSYLRGHRSSPDRSGDMRNRLILADYAEQAMPKLPTMLIP